MDKTEVIFVFQFGLIQGTASAEPSNLTLKALKELACEFIDEKVPNHGLNPLYERLLLYKHDYNSSNILQIVNNTMDVVDETLIEIVLTAHVPNVRPVQIRPHDLTTQSFKSPTFCDYCGEMLFGLVRQGLRCNGCNSNFHKRCAVSMPNKCKKDFIRRKCMALLDPQRSPSIISCAVTSESDFLPFGGPSPSIFVRKITDVFTKKSRSPPPNHFTNVVDPGILRLQLTPPLQIPHSFTVCSYTRPTICTYCKQFLRGLFKQGYHCNDCHCNVHKKCLTLIPKDCNLKSEDDSTDKEPNSEESSDDPGEKYDKNFKVNEYYGSQQELLIDFSSPEEPEKIEIREPEDNRSRFDKTRCMISRCDSNSSLCSTSSAASKSASISLESQCNNIPLMRIIQSIKNTKRCAPNVFKEGWMVHFTDRDPIQMRHYWRLDSKTITLYLNDTGTKFYEEIPLSNLMCVCTVELHKSPEATHCFEMRTLHVDYFVGEDHLRTNPDAKSPPLDSGIGAEYAKSWEISIRSALAPKTSEINSVDGVPDKHDLMVRELVEQYKIYKEEILGSGQFGTVYGGIHRETGRSVAIKVIDKFRFPTKHEAQLKNEVGILENLSHLGVVNLEKTFESIDRIYVVMEKLKGDMLEMILNSERGRLSERITKFLVTQILVALKHLHSKNIVHCDLKPENVLLSSNDEFTQVKLCDFGYARIIGEKSFRRSVVGTPAYLAPEVLRNKGYNRSLDMWSVGVIIYVALSGTFPFNEDEDINDQIQNAGFMYPPVPWKEISSDAIDLIINLLQVKQRKRLTVDKSLLHIWLQDYQTWLDLRRLEQQIGTRYLTHESDDERWLAYACQQF